MKTPYSKKLLNILVVVTFFFLVSVTAYGQDFGIGTLTGKFEAIIKPIYKFFTILVVIGAIYYGKDHVIKAMSGGDPGAWTKVVMIVLVIAVWIWGVPAIVSQMGYTL